jgi:dipeptidyl aminopeptidase/acylaminoacyl peptidase
MRRTHPIIICLAIVASTFGAAAGCSSKKELKAAKSSVYDTDFAVVYNAAVDATRDLYPTLNDNPGPGMIKTAWHQVTYANNQDDLGNQRTIAAGQGVSSNQVTQGQAAAGMPTRLAYKRFFIRFDVSVVGGRPWRVKIVGHASEWEPGNALPTELQGPARPPWLDGRTDSLTLAIYKKIKAYAVPMKKDEEPVKPEDLIQKTDPKAYANVPATAAKALAGIRDALVRRDLPALRAALADDVLWSLGGEPGADTAMAMWQADSEALEAMQRVLTAGCTGAEKKVTCPPATEPSNPAPGTYSLVLELRGDGWKVTSFVKAE